MLDVAPYLARAIRNYETGGTVKDMLGGLSAIRDLYNVLHEALKKSAFFLGDFLSISRPEGQVERPDADLRPTKAWTVDVTMVMHGKSPQKPGRKSLKAGSK